MNDNDVDTISTQIERPSKNDEDVSSYVEAFKDWEKDFDCLKHKKYVTLELLILKGLDNSAVERKYGVLRYRGKLGIFLISICIYMQI